MKLATLADPVKVAFRENTIDTGTAEAFAAVPEDRQLEIWQETGGHPRHAEHVRNIIANGWIDASHAMFDISTLPESVVTRDLFGDRVLIERQAFMDGQTQALESQRQALSEDGWHEVIIGRREDVQDRLFAMNTPERAFDKETEKKLTRINKRHEKLEVMAEQCVDDPTKLGRVQKHMETLEAEEQGIIDQAPEVFSEETKSVATAFLILDPDGRAHREYRIPRVRHSTDKGSRSEGDEDSGSDSSKPPTSDDLRDNQLAVTFTHQALAVREALLGNELARKRVLVLLLHNKVRSEALAIHHDANGTTLHASQGDGFSSAAFDRLQAKRAKVDPFVKEHFVDDEHGYEQLRDLSASKLDTLIDVLLVELLTAHMQRRTTLIYRLAKELKVNIRDVWRPDAAWLGSYQKIQLGHLIAELKGTVNAPPPERKKSELVAQLSALFADATEGKLEDKALAKRVNQWLPSNMRDAIDEE
jgi:hypothetical protein